MDPDEGSKMSVATWRILTLFVAIIGVDLFVEFGNEAITHHLRHKRQSGLLHAWEQLKFETMALGLVSLLLIVGEEQLLKICINSPADAATDYVYADSAPGLDTATPAARSLLAKVLQHACPDGKEPVWESKLIHKAHLLVFLIAAVHILYSLTSIGLSMLSMRRWNHFERQVQAATAPLPRPWAERVGYRRTSFWLGLKQCLRQFYRPLDIGTYAALRRLFLQKMNVATDFNFAAFVNDYLAEEFSSVVKFDVFMWLMAIIWVAFPGGWYAGFFITAIFMYLSVVAGAKLHMEAIRMALAAPAEVPPPSEAEAPPQEKPSPRAHVSVSLEQRSRKLHQTSLPHAIAEGVEDHRAGFSDRAALHTGLSSDNLVDVRRSEHSSAVSGNAGAGKQVAWFGFPAMKARVMLRIFRYAYFENAIALAVLVFGFWKEEGSIFGREAQYGKGRSAVAWLLADVVLLLILHSSMFLLPLYALTTAAAEFWCPDSVLEFARERGIREDLVAFLEETEEDLHEQDKSNKLTSAIDSPASTDSLLPPPVVLPSPGVAPIPPAPHRSPLSRAALTHPALDASGGTSPGDTGDSIQGSSAASLRRPTPATNLRSSSSLPMGSHYTPASNPASGPLGGPGVTDGLAVDVAAATAPVQTSATSKLNMLRRISAASSLHRQSVSSLRRESVPHSPSHSARSTSLQRRSMPFGYTVPTTLGYSTLAPEIVPEEPAGTEALHGGGGSSRSTGLKRLSLMADVVLGTDFLERSAQANAPHGGNIARANDDVTTSVYTAPAMPFVMSASRHAHSVQGLLEAMAMQRMADLTRAAAANQR